MPDRSAGAAKTDAEDAASDPASATVEASEPCPETVGAPPAAPATPPSRISPFAAFQSVDFRYYTAARVLATVGIQMQSVAVGYQVYDLTHRPLDLGYVGLAQFVPVIGLSLVTGQVADRFDRRRILFACDLAFALTAGALWFLAQMAKPSLIAVYAVITLVGVARAFYGPAGSSLVPSLVPKEHLANALSWQSTLWQIASIAGPSLGGLLYAANGHPGLVYLITVIMVVLAGVAILLVRFRSAVKLTQPPSFAVAVAGLKYVFSQKLLLGSISLDFFAVFLGGAVAMLPAYATDVLHAGPTGLGLLRAAPAIGAGLTALFLAFRPLERHAGPKMLAGVAVFGVATIVFGLSTSLPLSIGALALLGAADMVSVVVRSTMVQLATPQEMRGRVAAVNLVFVGASNELGEFESGTAAALLGLVPSVVAGGVGTMIVVGLWALLFKPLRTVDRLEDVKPGEG